MDISGLLWLLVWLVIAGLILYVLWWGIGRVGLPEPFNKVATVVLVLITVVLLIWVLTSVVPMPRFPR